MRAHTYRTECVLKNYNLYSLIMIGMNHQSYTRLKRSSSYLIVDAQEFGDFTIKRIQMHGVVRSSLMILMYEYICHAI